MKKILGIAISVLMIFTLAACEKTTDDSSNKIVVHDSSLEKNKIGNTLQDEFIAMVGENPDMSAQEIAEALIANEIITFQGMTMPVENGLLTGFGNNEVEEFKEGVMFGPAIGSIPFIGYIFKLDDKDNILGFMTGLYNNADKRWNVCTEADNIDIWNVGSTVFFLMSPDSLEDEVDSMADEAEVLKEEADRAEADKVKEKLDSLESEVARLEEEADRAEADKVKDELNSLEEEVARLKAEADSLKEK